MRKYSGYFQIRVEPEIKIKVTEILKKFGITPSQLIRMFFNSVIYHRGLPPILQKMWDEERNGKGKDD